MGDLKWDLLSPVVRAGGADTTIADALDTLDAVARGRSSREQANIEWERLAEAENERKKALAAERAKRTAVLPPSGGGFEGIRNRNHNFSSGSQSALVFANENSRSASPLSRGLRAGDVSRLQPLPEEGLTLPSHCLSARGLENFDAVWDSQRISSASSFSPNAR